MVDVEGGLARFGLRLACFLCCNTFLGLLSKTSNGAGTVVYNLPLFLLTRSVLHDVDVAPRLDIAKPEEDRVLRVHDTPLPL